VAGLTKEGQGWFLADWTHCTQHCTQQQPWRTWLRSEKPDDADYPSPANSKPGCSPFFEAHENMGKAGSIQKEIWEEYE